MITKLSVRRIGKLVKITYLTKEVDPSLTLCKILNWLGNCNGWNGRIKFHEIGVKDEFGGISNVVTTPRIGNINAFPIKTTFDPQEGNDSLYNHSRMTLYMGCVWFAWTGNWEVLEMTISGGSKMHIGGLVQERCNSIANALELRLSCTNPSIWISKLKSS